MKAEYESVKVKKEIVNALRKIKKDTGISASYFIELSVLERIDRMTEMKKLLEKSKLFKKKNY